MDQNYSVQTLLAAIGNISFKADANNSFNFKDINLEIDRYTIIDATDGQEKYVLYANYQFNG